MTARRKPATWLGRCVLAVALLFGIVLMHALGHPGEHAVTKLSDGHITTTSHVSDGHITTASHVSDGPAHRPAVAEPLRTTDPAPAHGAGVTTTVCLAVLGAGIGALLVARAVLGGPTRAVGTAVTRRFGYALLAIPPPAPPGSLLSRLSLLRI
ncbi:hypothetical protein ACFW5D_04530 [Streptomyces sp. NPDC058770]|uniref:hypothetical protein n=1 Tax=Streptomyces sp. NPDC058770 TaxID=3346631 RepID=UPI00369B66D9